MKEDSKRLLSNVINRDDNISDYGTASGSTSVKTTPTEVTSWRRFLIGPLLSVYMFGYMMSYYTITEYTNKTWHDKKFKEANITVSSSAVSLCITNVSSAEFEVENEATSMASQYMVYYSLSQGIPAVISNLVLGSYTDALGRKFLIGVGISGTTLRLIVSVIIIYFKFDLLFFIGACLIEGCTGQYATFLQVSLAYAGDITKPGKQRTNGMAYIMFMLGTSLTLASFAAGYLIQNYNFYVPLVVAAILLMISFLIMLFCLPESFPPEKRKTHKSFREVVGHSFSFFISKDIGNNRWKYQFLLLAHGFCDFSFLGRIGTETIYQMSQPFCWSAEKVQLYFVFNSSILFNLH